MNANANHTAPDMSSFKMLRAMVGIGILCALLIVLTYEGTFSQIEKNKAEALEKAIFKVVPGMVSKRNFIVKNDGSIEPDQGQDGKLIYAGYDENGALAGVAVEASGQGFADILRILYGYDPEKQAVVGFYVLESKETPGLGDKIEKDDKFLANFEALDVAVDGSGKQLANPVTAVKHGEKEKDWEIDCITGATISSRAIGAIIAASSEQWIPAIREQRNVFTTENNGVKNEANGE